MEADNPLLEDIDFQSIQDLEGARRAMARLLNLIEDLTADPARRPGRESAVAR